MRIALVPDRLTANTAYRSIGPLTALSQRGHETRRLGPSDRRTWQDVLRWCDLLHIHRICDAQTITLAQAAKASGAAVVWDDDDDTGRPPKELSGRNVMSGRKGAQWLAARRRLFQHVDLVTTPSRVLADVFKADGAAEVRVIENHVIDSSLGDRMPRRGTRIGWTACLEHKMDLAHMPIVSVLEALLDVHPDLHVTTMGIRLDALRSDRYLHLPGATLTEMLKQVSGFDVGIAPLSSEVGINHARSNVKLKEYAAVGVPWLASPIGPYDGLGERQGGRLVADDRWFEELDALVRSDRARRRLAKRATRWGREQLLSRNVQKWEHAFSHAVARTRELVA